MKACAFVCVYINTRKYIIIIRIYAHEIQHFSSIIHTYAYVHMYTHWYLHTDLIIIIITMHTYIPTSYVLIHMHNENDIYKQCRRDVQKWLDSVSFCPVEPGRSWRLNTYY